MEKNNGNTRTTELNPDAEPIIINNIIFLCLCIFANKTTASFWRKTRNTTEVFFLLLAFNELYDFSGHVEFETDNLLKFMFIVVDAQLGGHLFL